MSDRYRDRHDLQDDGRYDYSDDGAYAGSGRYRSSRSASDPYADSMRRTASSYSRQSGAYQASGATRSSSGAGAYADGYHETGDDGRLSQGNDAGRRQRANVFEEYYPDETVDTYRRSSYGSGSSRSTASRYSRASSQGPSRMTPEEHGHADAYAPKRSNRKRNLIIAAVVVVAVVLVGAGAAWAYVNSISQNLHEGIDQETLDALEPATPTATSLGDAPFYMLLMGTDTSEDRVATQEEYADGTARSDSMMLTRVDPVNKKVTLISIHRDTMVNLGEYGEQKINAAYAFWGPAGAIQAVSTMAGVPISHYASVDFDGFREIVDSLGGVEVNVPMEIDDEVIPAHLDAGWQTLNGTQALDLCRSRHAYDDVADDGDVMRAANQRMVIGAIAKKVLSSDILTIANTVQAMSKYVTTDLDVSDIIGLAQIFQGVDPANDIYTAMEPTTSAYIDETWYEFLDKDGWDEMIARMDKGLPPVTETIVDERTGTVLATSGTGAENGTGAGTGTSSSTGAGASAGAAASAGANGGAGANAGGYADDDYDDDDDYDGSYDDDDE